MYHQHSTKIYNEYFMENKSEQIMKLEKMQTERIIKFYSGDTYVCMISSSTILTMP